MEAEAAVALPTLGDFPRQFGVKGFCRKLVRTSVAENDSGSSPHFREW